MFVGPSSPIFDINSPLVFTNPHDYNPRMELDDSECRLTRTAQELFRKTEASGSLEDLCDHRELFAAYPGIEDIQITFLSCATWRYGPDAQGMFLNDGSIVIRFGQTTQDRWLLATVLHEVQHDIQERENFMPGTTLLHEAKKQMAKEKQHIEEQIAFCQQINPEIPVHKLRAIKKYQRRRALRDHFEKLETQGTESTFPSDLLNKIQDRPDDQLRCWQLQERALYNPASTLHSRIHTKAREVYFESPGEVEARTVEARHSYSMKERLKVHPMASFSALEQQAPALARELISTSCSVEEVASILLRAPRWDRLDKYRYQEARLRGQMPDAGKYWKRIAAKRQKLPTGTWTRDTIREECALLMPHIHKPL